MKGTHWIQAAFGEVMNRSPTTFLGWGSPPGHLPRGEWLELSLPPCPLGIGSSRSFSTRNKPSFDFRLILTEACSLAFSGHKVKSKGQGLAYISKHTVCAAMEATWFQNGPHLPSGHTHTHTYTHTPSPKPHGSRMAHICLQDTHTPSSKPRGSRMAHICLQDTHTHTPSPKHDLA